MSAGFLFSRLSSCYLCLLFAVVLFRLCLSKNNFHDVLCMDNEKQALLEFKHSLIDEADRLASWDVGEKNDCCNWTGIVCDNITGHVHKIHLPGNCRIDDFDKIKEYEECLKQKLKGDLSPSLQNLKQLKHLDLSYNDFGGMQVPRFMGSFKNMRYLNLTHSKFGGTIPPQLGNLSQLRVLCLGSYYEDWSDENESTSTMNMQWLSRLHVLQHLDLSGVDLSKSINWLQVINILPSLVQLHMSRCKLSNIHPHVSSLNLTSLSLLDLSYNRFNNNLVPQWIFNIASLVSLDLSWCDFHGPILSSSSSFHNLTSLKFLRVPRNYFMNSSLVLKGLSNIGSNLISLDISNCGVSTSVLKALHNLTSLLNLEMFGNELTNTISGTLGDFCNLKRINLGGNNFQGISLTFLLESFFECKSASLESLSLYSSELSSHLPDQLEQLKNLVHIQLAYNRIAGPIPSSIGGLSSLELLDLSTNRLNGNLPHSLGLLSKLLTLDISYNLLTGVMTEAHFTNLNGLKYLNGIGNNLTLRPCLTNWLPSFQLQDLRLSSWDLGPQFPLWLLQQKSLVFLEIINTSISATVPLSFWRSFPNLRYLDMSQNNIQGSLSGIPATLITLYLSSNKFSGQLPQLSNSSMIFLDLSNNLFVGSLYHLLCPNGGKWLEVLNLANNHLSGVNPDCWEKYPNLNFLNLENNCLSGRIPKSLGSISSLESLNMCNNKLSGRLPTSLKNLTKLSILQLARNKFIGSIPAWLGRQLSSLRLLNLRLNNFDGSIPDELCYLTAIQILDLAHNNLSGNIPRCFNNFTLLSGKNVTSSDRFTFSSFENTDTLGSASLVIKGREDTYTTILGLVMILDLSSNNFSGGIPCELMVLQALQSLNLSRNQLAGRIPEKIGDLKALVSFDVSLNRLSGELPVSLLSLSFLSSFNVSYNNLTGRIPSSTQLQTLNESSFFGNRLCGPPLTESCAVPVPDRDQDHRSNGADWGFIISIAFGFISGFWIVVTPLIVSRSWRIAYFCFLSKLRYMVCDVIHKYFCNMFHKSKNVVRL